jgi:hypothetical protein
MGRTERQAGAKLARPQFLNEQGLIFGASYEGSAAVVPDGTPPVPVADPVTEYVPSARPGGRAPHAWLMRGDERISTIDLFGPRFVLLAGPRGAAWRDAARHLADDSRPPIQAWAIGAGGDLGDPDGAWRETYGVEEDGAVLVRPDGYVAWRSRAGAADTLGTLRRAWDAVLGRGAPPPPSP